MSLSASTLTLFVLLIPGLIFRFSVFFGSPIKRPFSAGNSIFASIVIVFFSVGIHIISYIVSFLIIVPSFNYITGYDYNFIVTVFDEKLYVFENNVRFPIYKFVLEHKFYTILYFSFNLITALIAAFVFRFLALRYASIGRLLYGPIAPLINDDSFDFLTCFVLTKAGHEHKYVAYAGYAIEVSLKDGNNIDHIIIEGPEKFFVKIEGNWPKTTYKQSRPISSDFSSSGIMYISGSEIQNVHFESWYFN